jgi:hypothetical protein
MQTSQPFTPVQGSLMLSLPDSLARTSAPQIILELDWTVNVQDSSSRSFASFASVDPVTSYWKTSQRCLVPTGAATWEQYSGSFPRAGTMRNGKLFPLLPLVPTTFESGYGLLPTPIATDDRDRSAINVHVTKKGTIKHRTKRGTKSCARVSQVLHFVGRPDLAVSAQFREWTMGYPRGWTKAVPAKAGIKIMGNGIVPQVAAIPMQRILDLESHRNPP